MHWELNEEQELFASSLREWLTARFPADVVREMGTADERARFTSALVDEGWWGVGYPEEVGGQGGAILELALAAREFGRAAAPDARWLAGAIAAPLLDDDELAAHVTGDTAFAVAIPGDRLPDSAAPLVLDENAVSGEVCQVVAAEGAEVFLVPVSGGGYARVAAADAEVRPKNLLDRSRSAATVRFDASPAARVAPAGEGAAARVAVLAAVLVSSAALGSAERMLDLTVEYSKQRKQFGQPIGAFQAVKHAAAQMLVTVEAARSVALYAAAAADAGLEDTELIAAVAKAQSTGSIAELAESALTVHGAIGYTWEHDLHLFYKRAKLDRVLFGTPGAWNERIAANVIDRAASPA